MMGKLNVIVPRPCIPTPASDVSEESGEEVESTGKYTTVAGKGGKISGKDGTNSGRGNKRTGKDDKMKDLRESEDSDVKDEDEDEWRRHEISPTHSTTSNNEDDPQPKLKKDRPTDQVRILHCLCHVYPGCNFVYNYLEFIPFEIREWRLSEMFGGSCITPSCTPSHLHSFPLALLPQPYQQSSLTLTTK